MKSLIGIAIEQFEYNTRWKLAVIFLTFFAFSTISLKLLVAPKIEISHKNGNAAIELLSDKLNLSEDSENKAKGILDKISSKLSSTKSGNDPQDAISTSVDETNEVIDHRQHEPTTLETLNED